MITLLCLAGACSGCVEEPAAGRLTVGWHFGDDLDCGGAGVETITVESPRARFSPRTAPCQQGAEGVDVGLVPVGFARVDATGLTRAGGESYFGTAAVDVDGGEEYQVDVTLVPAR